MNGEKDLEKLLKTMKPKLNSGEYVFCEVKSLDQINTDSIVMFFKEEEAITVIVQKETADLLKLDYSYIASWITLTVHSSLEAVGLNCGVFEGAFRKSD